MSPFLMLFFLSILIQIFFAGPSFPKADHSGFVCPIDMFMFSIMPFSTVLKCISQTTGFMFTGQTCFGRHAKAIVIHWKYNIKIAKTARIYIFVIRHKCRYFRSCNKGLIYFKFNFALSKANSFRASFARIASSFARLASALARCS